MHFFYYFHQHLVNVLDNVPFLVQPGPNPSERARVWTDAGYVVKPTPLHSPAVPTMEQLTVISVALCCYLIVAGISHPDDVIVFYGRS